MFRYLRRMQLLDFASLMIGLIAAASAETDELFLPDGAGVSEQEG
ncbi:MAG: hypothetical protein AAGD43_08295 [Pseudomonadota bacterium]